MDTFRIYQRAAGRLFCAALTAGLILLSGALGAEEEQFDLLQIGTQTYTNVTVTTKATNYIFIVHNTGMVSIKVADLPPEVREKLGYAKTSKPKDGANSAEEQRFDLLQIGTRRYTNVTVTTKTTNYIFIVHAAGMASLKVAELPLEVREKLGYVKRRPLAGTNSAVAWAKMEIAKLKVPQIKELKNQLNQRWGSEKPIKERTVLGMKTYPFLLVASLFALAVHLFQCYCCILICEKTGNEPGVLIWLPVLQLIPLLRAAGMSGWWFVAFFVPLLNLVAWILWSFNIAKARSKSIWVGVLLLLPLTSLFAFLYLAFSDGGAPEQEEKEDDSGIVTLEMVWGLIGLTTVMGHLSFWVLM